MTAYREPADATGQVVRSTSVWRHYCRFFGHTFWKFLVFDIPEEEFPCICTRCGQMETRGTTAYGYEMARRACVQAMRRIG